MTVLYDNRAIYQEILLDLPFREATGIITQDVAKPHHPVTLVNTPTWAALDNGLSVLTLDGTTEYLQSVNASTADLGFTAVDYSIAAWFKWSAEEDSQIVLGRWQLDVGGWEIYLYAPTLLLTQRHHHAGGAALRSAVYSGGWTQDTWHFMGMSRSGVASTHYRNGVALTMIGALEDPEATTQDLVIGVRYSKNANYFKGSLWRPRVWPKVLTAEEWVTLYEHEKAWFA